jgi:hypothetical protein
MQRAARMRSGSAANRRTSTGKARGRASAAGKADPTTWPDYAAALSEEKAALWDFLRELRPRSFSEDGGAAPMQRSAFLALSAAEMSRAAAGVCLPGFPGAAPTSPLAASLREWDHRTRGRPVTECRPLPPLRDDCAAPDARLLTVQLTPAQVA